MALSRVTSLTTDHERIASVVERLKDPPESLFDLQLRDRWQGGDTSPATEQLIDSWLDPIPKGDALFKDAVALLLGTSEYKSNVDADLVRTWKRRLAVNDVLKVVAGIEHLRRIEGEKHLVLVTAFGFSPPFTFINQGIGLHFYSADDDRRMAARANDAGIAIDIIQTAGPGLAALSIMSSQNVSDHSGGQFSGNRTAEQQLQRIDDASRSGYILGHVPTNPAFDGKYRNILVTVNRKDVTVVYRRGYTATADPGHIDPRDVYTRSRMRDAAVGNTDLSDIGLGVAASLSQAARGREVRVDVKVDVSRLALKETSGRHEGEIDLLILIGDSKQEVVGRLDQRMTLSMNQALYEEAIAGGVPYTATIPVTGTPVLVKAIVFHFDSDRLGTATATIR